MSNYDVLKRALADVELLNKLNEKWSKIETSNEKEIKEIEEAYNKLDLLQRSLDVNETLYKSIKNLLNEPNDLEEIKAVRSLNQAIINLLTYENSLVKYVAADVDSLQEIVKTLEADIEKLSQSYRAAVQNQAILTEAKSDIKRSSNLLNHLIN